MNNNFTEKANFLWSIADLIRDDFKRSKYADVILPLTVLRRIDCVLEPTKLEVLKQYKKFKGQLANPDPILRKASGYAFYNTSPYTFERLLEDPPHLADNLKAYINGFSENMREVIERFDFRNTIAKLDEAGLLFLVLERFKNIDLHPDVVDNYQMGTIFEELIRRFNEALDENPGEHFTPREVVRLMVDLLLAPESEALRQDYRVIKVADPACGTGGMLTIAKERLLGTNPKLQIYIYGQEVNPETFAVCKSDLYMKSADGKDAENIAFGSTLSNDAHPGEGFDYQLANPPYGKEWKKDQDAVETESSKPGGRFSAGLPRISDGQLLFLQHMLSHMNPAKKGGGRVAIVMNGSPLFTGDAGSGESEIRRWILENDWLEAIVALPEQLFYNTGIATYIWVLSNRKEAARRGKVQLIDATSIWTAMRKSLGDKRREISEAQIKEIVNIYLGSSENGRSKIFDTTNFGYRKITVERPLRLNFQASEERIAQLQEQTAFSTLAQSKKKDASMQILEIEAGREQQKAILTALRTLPKGLFKDRPAFEKELDAALKRVRVTLSAALRKVVLAALSERDETADICRDKEGNPEPDPDLRDTENIPLKEDIAAFFEREVKPHVPDAWINTAQRDPKDGEVGRVGYEINFNRYFYEYQPPRPLEEIEADIKKLEKEIMDMLHEITE
jgi:type I restriction enzyme M protein